METRGKVVGTAGRVLIGILVLAGISLTGRWNYLLFHTVAEVASIAVACAVFMIAWNSRQFSRNGYLLFVGIALLFIALLDLVHTLAYKGMGVFPDHDANLPTQLWIAARGLQAVSLALAPVWLSRALPVRTVFAAFAAVTALLLWSIFSEVFPACFVEGEGLTDFKKYAEYVIAAVLVGAGVLLYRKRSAFDRAVLVLLLLAIGATVLSELAFTQYVSVYGPANQIGHLLKLVAFYLIYVAIIETGLKRPYALLFRELKEGEEALLEANRGLAKANEELRAYSAKLLEQQSAMEEISAQLAVERTRLDAVMQQMPAGVLLVAPSGEILIWNEELARLFDRTLPPGATVHDYAAWERFHPDGRPYEPDQIPILRVLRDGETVTGEEVEVRHTDGTRCTLSINAAPILDQRGRIVAAVAVNLDVTERKRGEDAMRFLAQVSDAFASSLDFEVTLQRVARLAVPALGDCCLVDLIEPDGRCSRPLVVCAEPARQGFTERLRGVSRSAGGSGDGESAFCPGEVRLIEADDDPAAVLALTDEDAGVLREADIRGALVAPMVAHGRVYGRIAFLALRQGRSFTRQDLSVAQELAWRAAVAAENAKLYSEAQEANQAKDRFLAVVSHELRNPLSTILAGVHLLRQTLPADAKLEQALGFIERSTNLQARLVSDLLDMSLGRRGELDVRLATLELDQVVAAAVEAQRPEIVQAGLGLELELQPGLQVVGDADRLQQVVMNLLANATKFTPRGGEVRVRVRRDRRVAVVAVEDSGAGIAAALLPQVFELFRKGDTGDRRKPGLGIGLSLVRTLVELHGGQVRAESDGEGKGSRFTIELPLVVEPVPAD